MHAQSQVKTNLIAVLVKMSTSLRETDPIV